MPSKALPHPDVQLAGGLFLDRFHLNRAYVASLTQENLLQNFHLEAGLRQWTIRCSHPAHPPDLGEGRHWGWESPTCQVRGHFLGHWLSAAAQIWAATGDAALKMRAEAVVTELAVCQERNGDGWLAAFPPKYMDWLAQGRPTWAPQYVHHKTLMGLTHMHAFAGSDLALEIAGRFADWFHRWTGQFNREQLDDILDVETGGMLEAWADLYGITGERKYLDLIERYTRGRLFDALLEGRDPLTNMHANTTIPEAHGAARCYEVTGDERWRSIAQAYWDCAVTNRGAYCTGGQTSGEIWTPPFALAARRGDKNQEHCTVYNMIRLADYLLRWTGEARYADYIERNLYNGVLAQQNPATGQISYFLPLEAGARKRWGHPTFDFWCCHGSLVQAHCLYGRLACYRDDDGLRIAQYIPARIRAELQGTAVELRLSFDPRNGGTQALTEGAAPWSGSRHRPSSWLVRVEVACDRPMEFALRLRLPDWLSGPAALWVNGEKQAVAAEADGFSCLRRTWHQDTVLLELPKGLSVSPIPDEPETVAFMDGPVVLAGLCAEEVTLAGDQYDPRSILVPDNEREWGIWLNGYRTVNQPRSIRFSPLYEVVDEPYTLYFPIRSR